jgi:voltage-gated potassium channel Kch
VIQPFLRAYLARRYGVLFYSLLLTLCAAPGLVALGFDTSALQVFIAVNLVLAVIGGATRRLAPLFLLVIAALGVRLAATVLRSDALATATLPFWSVLGLIAVAAAVRFALRGAAIDAEHLYAALSGYLLAGLFFGLLYWVVEDAWTGSFAVSGASVAPGQFSLANGIYFSFVTLATLGYGDVVPQTEIARGLAILEAVSGQLYLAVMVARLVSLYVGER